jgi:hypothetical protein
VTDVVTGGAGAVVEQSIAQGDSRAKALAKGTSVGAINLATFGTADMANAALEDKGGVPGVIADTVAKAANKVGEILGWGDATHEANAASRNADASAAPAETSPGNKALLGGIGSYAGAHFVELGLKSRPGLGRGALITFGAAGLISGVSLMADALVAAAHAEPQPKAFLNEGAERKAAQTPKAPASTVVASAAVKKADGETAGYSRRGKNGQTIQVQAYRTPDRR